MTWPEVADTALKIGLPAAIAGTVAILVSRSGRLHDFEKERRRRKNDCLERAIEDFGDCDVAADEFYVLSHTAAAFKDNPDQNLRIQVSENLVRSVEKTEIAEAKLHRSRSKLEVFGFRVCADALEAYTFAVSKERVALEPMRKGEDGWQAPLADSHEERISKALAFRAAITDALKQL